MPAPALAERRQGGDAGAYVALPGEKDQHVAGLPRAVDLQHDLLDAGQELFRIAAGLERAILDPHRMYGRVDADDRAAVEVLREHLGVDGGGGDDHLEVGALGEHSLQQSQHEVDGERTLVRFIHDHHAVFAQQTVVLELLQQHAVGHDLDFGALAGGVLEAHLVGGDGGIATVRGELGTHEVGYRDRRDPARLGHPDTAVRGIPGIVEDAGELGGLARTGGAPPPRWPGLRASCASHLVALAGDRKRRGELRNVLGGGLHAAFYHRRNGRQPPRCRQPPRVLLVAPARGVLGCPGRHHRWHYRGRCVACVRSATIRKSSCMCVASPSSRRARSRRPSVETGYVGQDRAVTAVSLMAYRHVSRLRKMHLEGISRDLLPDKTNLLLVGPTGCGKTHLVELLFQHVLHLPTIIVDLTGYSETGYVGQEVTSILTRLLYTADLNQVASSVGVVCLDEFDKVASGQNNAVFAGAGSTKDVSGLGVQRELLKMLEAAEISVPNDLSHSEYGARTVMSTSDIAFIGCGAFSGFKGITDSAREEEIGFGRNATGHDPDRIAVSYTEDDVAAVRHFHRFGFLPELIGRFKRIVPFRSLSAEQLTDILRQNILRQYRNEFRFEDIQLEVDDAVLRLMCAPGTGQGERRPRVGVGVRAPPGGRRLRRLFRRGRQANPPSPAGRRGGLSTWTDRRRHARETGRAGATCGHAVALIGPLADMAASAR